ncbi:MAG: hypothetical protein CMG71_02830 [Candidatus Marinimicrobia bacterium]|nr:hypothetical protein [Candidatus Neomarinimicrobiota bacterium]
MAGQLVLEKDRISVLGLRVEFAVDDDASSTGNGSFLTEPEVDQCGSYTIDPPPHNKAYFEAHFQAVNHYFQSVSYGNFGLDLDSSFVLPAESTSSYLLDGTMASYYPYGDKEGQEVGMARLFKEAIESAYADDAPKFDDYDVVIIFHAGIGQDFALPFIDPTQTDIPSIYIDSQFLQDNLGSPTILLSDGSSVSSGIVLPETQNHLLYAVSSEIFTGVTAPCDYQFGLTGTFALMLGIAVGLPPLWNRATGESGVGLFALMDQGSNNGRGVIPSPPDPWTRIWAGWETGKRGLVGDLVTLASRDSLNGETVQFDISSEEYFLIENRNNRIKGSVDIDSMRWSMSGLDVARGYVEVMLDSSGVSRDVETGVIIDVPNYDLGLPGSGLLIWHIDERRIATGLASQTVNGDRKRRGIDLEEADGAQDIGYPSAFLFTDPSSGLWSDMWFDGNSQYVIANPEFANRPPSFGPDTYPDTRDNSGANTYLRFDLISEPGKTMTFSVSNSLMMDGFPDRSLNMQLAYDLRGDGKHEILGISDSLWWSPTDEIEPNGIIAVGTSEQRLVITNVNETPQIAIASVQEGDVVLELFSFSLEHQSFQSDWTASFSGKLPHRLIGFRNESKVALNYSTKRVIVTADSLWKEPVEEGLTARWGTSPNASDAGSVVYVDGSGLTVTSSTGVVHTGFDHIGFQSLAVAELDGDEGVEIIAIDSDGSLYALNENLTFLSGFPVEAEAAGEILIGQLSDTYNPEIVTYSSSGKIRIFDWSGSELFNLAGYLLSRPKIISSFNGKNALVTSSEVWLFDEADSDVTPDWPTAGGDIMNRRFFQTSAESRPFGGEGILSSSKTYCYPNPIEEGSATLRVTVEDADEIVITVYDLTGLFVERIEISPVRPYEVNEVIWDVRNIESGVYLANVEAFSDGKSDSKILKIAIVH